MLVLIKILICLFQVIHCLIGLSTSDKRNLNYIKVEEIFLMEIEEYYVIFSLPECMSCLTLNEYLEKSFSQLDLIYLIDISSQEYKNNLMQKNNVGVSSFTDIQINKAPTLLFIKSKVIIDQIEGLEVVHSYLEKQF